MRSAALTPRRVRLFWRVKLLCDHLLMRVLGLDAETYRRLPRFGERGQLLGIHFELGEADLRWSLAAHHGLPADLVDFSAANEVDSTVFRLPHDIQECAGFEVAFVTGKSFCDHAGRECHVAPWTRLERASLPSSLGFRPSREASRQEIDFDDVPF